MTPSIAASILNFNHADLRQPLADMKAGGIDWVHLDVMDGQFVPPLTFGDGLAKGIGAMSDLPMEAHLMVASPHEQIEAFVTAGCKRIIFHAEATHHAHGLAQHIHRAGAEAGIAINPGTSDRVIDCMIDHVELVLVMTVNPGWGGQKFLPETLKKIERVRAARADVIIEVDGGIDPTTIGAAQKAGANLFVVGSYLMKPPTIGEAVQHLRAACS